MENQKTLWIVFSITLFILVVVVVGFIWFLPPDVTDPGDGFADAGVVEETTAAAFDPITWVRGTEEVPGMTDSEDESTGDMLFVVGASEDDSDEESADGADAGTSTPVDDESVTTVRVATPAATPARTSAPAVTTTASTLSAKPQPVATPAAPTTVRVTNYWIQVGSFQSRSRAEEVQSKLGENNFTARITSTDVENTTYFRVRIGPYESKPEAEKFLSWLKEVDSFGSSYISEVYTTRAAN